MDQGLREAQRGEQCTKQGSGPAAETRVRALVTTQTQGASTCAFPALPSASARSGPGPGVSDQYQPRTLGDSEGESGSRSPRPSLRRRAMLKFPIDWRSQRYRGGRETEGGKSGSRNLQPTLDPGGGAGVRTIPPSRNTVHARIALPPSTHYDCESHYRRRARDFLNIYSPLSAR